MNAFFSHGEAEYFLARRDGLVLGRISAQINHAFNEVHDCKWGWFGFLELEDDPEVLSGLLAAAQEWLAKRGCERMVGPADFTMNDESGVLIEGFDLRPMIRQPWHPPYYQRLLEDAGLTKAMDLFMWNLEVSDRDKVLPVIWELADKARRPASACVLCAAGSCAKTSTCSPRSTTRRGRRIGTSFPLQEGSRGLRPRAAPCLRQALVDGRPSAKTRARSSAWR